MPNNSSTLSSPSRNPPAWLNRSAYWFRIGLILFSVITLLLGTTACTSNSSAKTILSSWQPATKLTSRESLVQIVQSHSNLIEIQSATFLNRTTIGTLCNGWFLELRKIRACSEHTSCVFLSRI